MTIEHVFIALFALAGVVFIALALWPRRPADPCADCPQKGSIWECHNTRCSVRELWYAQTMIADLERDRRRLLEAAEKCEQAWAFDEDLRAAMLALTDAINQSYTTLPHPDRNMVRKADDTAPLRNARCS